MSFNKERFMYCVVKKAYMFETPEKGSKVVGEIEFGKRVSVSMKKEIVNGRIRATYREIDSRKTKLSYSGWVAVRALTKTRIEDYANLYFSNRTGKRVPVTYRFHGKTDSYIEPGDYVTMIAKVGDWCLTSKGWTMFNWLTKERDIVDASHLQLLLYGILARAAEDYRLIVKKIQQGKYADIDEFCSLVWRFDELCKWFRSQQYAEMFDPVSGKSRLAYLNSELGIDKAWIRKQHEYLLEFGKRGKVYFRR